METVIIKTQNKSDIRFLLDFAKRIGASAKAVDTDTLEDMHLAALIEKGLKTASVSREDVLKALRQ